MLPKGLLSKIGGLLAVISLTVLPLTGCGSYTISGSSPVSFLIDCETPQDVIG